MGTLDPFAEGVLPVCIGKATKLIEYLADNKSYIAEIKFGAETDTFDLDGKIINTYDKRVTQDEILSCLDNFRGESSQIPPIYSAIKVGGKKLYDYAREGKDVNIKPRRVTIFSINLISFDEQNQSAKISVRCSKGTYIRSIAYDLGKILGCGGYLTSLERDRSGFFDKVGAVKMEDLQTIEDVEKYLINPLDVMPHLKYAMEEKEYERVKNGMWIAFNKSNITYPQNAEDISRVIEKYSNIVILTYSGKIYAVGKVDKDRIVIEKVD
jgi:tRNA pseudouridine55 synthase